LKNATTLSRTQKHRTSEAFILPRNKDGRCDMNAKHYDGVLTAQASGTVSYSNSN
jgi:hypothetical protein